MDIEAELTRLHAAGLMDDVAALLVSTYGPGILGFLISLAGDHADANDAFAQACEDLLKGLPRFEGRAKFKTWFYTLARHALSRHRRSPIVGGRVPLSAVSEQIEQVRSRTAPYLRSEVKTGIAAIRAELPEEDRALLALRVERELGWDEISRILCDDVDDVTALARASARLRKRFQIVKETIAQRARDLGLLGDDSDVG